MTKVKSPNLESGSPLPNSNIPELTRVLNWIIDRALFIKPGEVLNTGEPTTTTQNPAQALQKAAKGLTAEALDPTGETVDYKKIVGSVQYAKFRQFTLALPSCKPEDLGDGNDRIAFWLNLYNALVIDAVVHYQIDGSLLKRPSFFRRAAYNVAGSRFSADDIEHGILRGNQPHPFFHLRPFGQTDHRRMMIIEPVDPRIHFALVCGARSCPPISFYEGARLDSQLDLAAGSFINGGGALIGTDSNSVSASLIFKWYESDFGGLEGVLDSILKYSKDNALKELIRSGNPRIRYLNYDWTVNNLL